jgi:hypothetical protein
MHLKRGRKSPGHLAGLAFQTEHPRLDPPASLTDLERTIFLEVVESCTPEHFRTSDRSLLVAYVAAAALAQEAKATALSDRKAALTWEKATRAMATLASKLRLCPSTRSDPRTIARERPLNSHLRRPWDDLTPDEVRETLEKRG